MLGRPLQSIKRPPPRPWQLPDRPVPSRRPRPDSRRTADARREHGDHLAVTIDQVLLEVPRHWAGHLGVGMLRQEAIEWADVVALHRDLGEEIKTHVVFLGAELLDLQVGAGLLAHEVVGREGQDAETLVLVLAVERFEFLVVAIGEAALRRDIDDEEHVALVLVELHLLAVDGFDLEVVEALHLRICILLVWIRAVVRHGQRAD